MIKSYYQLIKPGVMYGNLLTTVAGFLFASNGDIDWILFLITTLGTSLVISSACVINNYLDQDIDSVMERTKSRPLITGEVSPKGALIFGIALLLIGVAILSLTNWWVVAIGIVGFIAYVWLYGAYGKRLSVHGTLVGSFSGALPILAGYVAVNPGLDYTGIILFLILFFWQMPEFYSISIFRANEYSKAKIPVISVVRGIEATKKQILAYTLITTVFILMLGASSLSSLSYLAIMTVFCARWIYISIQGIATKKDDMWAREMFRYSILILLIFSLTITINPYLP